MPNVLVLATRYFGPGGVQAYGRSLVSALADAGGRVDILSLFEEAPAPAGPGPGRYLGHLGRRSTVWTHARYLLEAVRRGKGYRLLVCAHVATAPLAALVHRWFGVPFVVVGHGIEVWGRIEPARRAALRRAARVIAVSRFTAARLVEDQGVAPERVAVVHPCVDRTLLDLAGGAPEPDRASEPDAGGIALLTVARLSAEERYKGCDTVLRALPAVAARTGPARYVIVGDGDDRPRLEALARESGAAVTFAGRAERSALARHYRACDVFVMPSVAERRGDGWAGEGFGIVYAEAAAFGRPVIAGAGGGAPEAVRDGVTGLVVDGRDVDAVAAALVRLAADRALRARMGEAGRAWVRERFTPERFRHEIAAAVAGVTGASEAAGAATRR